jgi:thiol:disulfide interchange protein DsbA
MLRALGIIFCLAGAQIAPAADEFVEGQHYERIKPEVSTDSGEQIEVVEVFWYGCPHCFSFEPYITKWTESKPADTAFRRVPGVFAQNWVPHARAYYTAEILGVLDKIHHALFTAIHDEKRKINTEDRLTEFFATHGVPEGEFLEVYGSFAVDAKVRQALADTRAYGITGVPSVIVNGKYRTSARQAGNYEALLKVIDSLVDKERAN